MVDCYVFGTPPLDFDGAVRRRRHSRPYQRAPSIGTGADGPHAEERAKAADAHCIAPVPCDEFLCFVLLAKALRKNTVCPVVKKRSRQISNCGFLFEQSYINLILIKLYSSLLALLLTPVLALILALVLVLVLILQPVMFACLLHDHLMVQRQYLHGLLPHCLLTCACTW